MKVTVPVTLPGGIINGTVDAVAASLDVETFPIPQTRDMNLDPGRNYVSFTVSVAIRGYGVDGKVHLIVPLYELHEALKKTHPAGDQTFLFTFEQCAVCEQAIADCKNPSVRQYGYGFVCATCPTPEK